MRIVFIILWVCVFVLFSLLSCGYFDPFDSASGSSLFVTGGNKILTSVDGKSWTETNFFITECITEFVYVKDAFLAVDTDGYLWKSQDGKNWNNNIISLDYTLTGIVYAGDTFICTGESGVLVCSYDAIQWQEVATGGLTNDFFGCTYGNNQFIIVGHQIIGRSQDACSWIFDSMSSDLFSVTFGDNKFVAVGHPGAVMLSDNGTVWTDASINNPDILFTRVTYDIGVFIAVGANLSIGGEKSIIYRSTDGLSWIDVSPPDDSDLIMDVQFGHNCFIAVSDGSSNGDGKIWRSRDGYEWEKTTFKGINFYAIGYRP